MCELCRQRESELGAAAPAAAGAPQDAATPQQLDEIAEYLADGFWAPQGGRRAFDAAPGDTLTYDTSALTTLGRSLADAAMQAWSVVTGLTFVSVSGGADIRFDDADSGAYAYSQIAGGRIVTSHVNVDPAWLSASAPFESYGFQTYLHEVGHALGLGHAGNYNGSATYGDAGTFAADSWQSSLMSYFDQAENTLISADFAFAMTPMAADLIAIADLYGATEIRSGDTVYGLAGTDGGYFNDLFDFGRPVALTLIDTGGHDVLELAHLAQDQRLDLRGGASDIGGFRGNLLIAGGTIIEDAILGAGNDTVSGNAAANLLSLGAGDDFAFGFGGSDRLIGGSGRDTLEGGAGSDILVGGTESAALAYVFDGFAFREATADDTYAGPLIWPDPDGVA